MVAKRAPVSLPRYVVLDKRVGETPLVCLEKYREKHPELKGVPMAYAGRLDPMASGVLLVLVGEECKRQDAYHGLDKAYEIEVLLGISSDSGDVLGLIEEQPHDYQSSSDWAATSASHVGKITLPYPHYSSRTVSGIPLHTWAVTGRLDEITIPFKTSTIHTLTFTGKRSLSRAEMYSEATQKIALLPTVTDERKALGNDFRRSDVYASWERVAAAGKSDDTFCLLSFTCICSSGTYMRTLADVLAQSVGTRGLAWSIHRTTIGRYRSLIGSWGLWTKRFISPR